jgi:hypothetical protein
VQELSDSGDERGPPAQSFHQKCAVHAAGVFKKPQLELSENAFIVGPRKLRVRVPRKWTFSFTTMFQVFGNTHMPKP